MSKISVEESDNLTLSFKGGELDKILGSESRKPNDYFGIYKISALVIGASGSGKTSFVLNLLFSDKLDCDNLVLIIPEESCYSGLYSSLIKFKKVKSSSGRTINVHTIVINKTPFPTVRQFQEANLTKCCIIVDDFVSCINKQDFDVLKSYTTQISRVSESKLFVLVQDYRKLSVTFRSNFTIFILFTSSVHRAVFDSTIDLFNGYIPKSILNDFYTTFKLIRYKPLILINNAPKGKSIIFDNNYINFEQSEQSPSK